MTRFTAIIAALALLGCSENTLRPTAPDVDPSDVTECEFTPIEEMPSIHRYNCNPVFQTTGENWATSLQFSTFNVTEVLGHPFYQLWYFAYTGDAPQPDQPDGQYDIGYAVSSNGTDWIPHSENPGWPEREDGGWDWGGIQRPYVEWDPESDSYLMMYGGFNFDHLNTGTAFFGIGLANSADGVDWELSPSNPVIDLGVSVSDVRYCWPMSFSARGGFYDAYIAGSTGAAGRCEMYRVRTGDPTIWNESPERILESTVAGEDWDAQGAVSNSVVEFDGTQYMFYVGFGDWLSQGTIRYTQNHFLGLAVSEDGGDSWERFSDVQLPVHMTESGSINMVAARRIGSRVHLWIEDDYGTEEEPETGIGYFLFYPDEL